METQTVAKLGIVGEQVAKTLRKLFLHIAQEQLENVDETKDYTKERTEFKNLYFYRRAYIM